MKKKVMLVATCALLMLALAIPCFATGGSTSGVSSDITSAFSTGFSQIASDATSVLVVIIPIALGIMGIIWVSKKAISWFKAMSRG